tara:strand:+ start:771 stop:1178 length:408 start_codon:yes stop_codon:yes gene_type:complete
MVFAVFLLSLFIVEGIRGIFVIIAIILPGGTKRFDSMSPRVAFMAQKLRGLLSLISSFICIFAIYAAIQTESFTTISGSSSRWGLQALAEWTGLLFILVTLFTFLVNRIAPFRIWFTDFKSLSDKEKMDLSRGSW